MGWDALVKRFSSSYVYGRSNYAVIGCDGDYQTESIWYQLACVVQNLIQRGTPTPASKRIKRLLGSPLQTAEPKPLQRYIAHDHHWRTTILGATNSNYNPARKFYEEILPASLPIEYRYAINHILPEAKISDIVENCDPRFTDQRVDFYCDQARLAIEIDGSQHDSSGQIYLDRERNLYLARNNVDTIRISTTDIDVAEVAKIIISRLNELEQGESCLETFDERISRAPFEVVMRTQIAILELIKTGRIDPEDALWNIDYVCDIPNISHKDLLKTSANDLFDLLEGLCTLAGIPFNRPKVRLDAKGEIRLNVSASKKWDERDIGSSAVLVRSDYFEDKNNYRVACSEPITYKTMQESRREEVDASLNFFLDYLFEYESFNPGQIGIMRRALARNATLGILPTGSGKSLCYQMACLLQPCVSFSVCPIVSLIQDQEANTVAFGIDRVGRIESQMDSSDKNAVLEALGEARLQLIWVTPERFQMKSFRFQLEEISKNQSFGYAVIDEVHCLSEWGHDFRVSYLKLYATITKYCPRAVILALTATASRNVLEDLLAELHITKANIQTSPSLDRPELHYHVVKVTDSTLDDSFDETLNRIDREFSALERLETIFEPVGEKSVCGIVFANTRTTRSDVNPLKGCEGIKMHLLSRQIKSDTYHSGRKEERTAIQKSYIDNEFTVMAATKAFGMGVNKKNVRYTIHCGLPWSIEAFYQEAGRAGRDPKNNYSECFILYEPDPDKQRTEALFAPNVSVKEIRDIQPALQGDLNTLFFLWGNNHEDMDIETEAVIRVFKKINKNKDQNGRVTIADGLVREEVCPLLVENMKPGTKAELRVTTQDVLYKLAILGVVKDWTVDYRGSRSYEVEVADEVSEESVKESLEKYIRRHTPSFSFDNPSSSHRKYVEMYRSAPEGRKFIGMIKVLLQWTNDNIVFNRRRSIGNMLNLCEANYSEENFRRYINNYFSLDTESNDQLDAIVNDQENLEVWFKLFTTYELTDDPLVQNELIKPFTEIEAIAALCDRYRESFNANIGLEWATMVAHLLAGNFNAREVQEQYAFIAQDISAYDRLDFNKLLDGTISLLLEATEEARDAFGLAVVGSTPQEAIRVQKVLGDTVTLEHLITTNINRLENVWGRISNYGK